MLTQDQIDKLNNLRTDYPQYSHLVTRMIEGWKETTPTPGFYGIDWLNFGNERQLSATENKCTCLLGACFIGISIPATSTDWLNDAFDQLQISLDEGNSIIFGFDDRCQMLVDSPIAYSFAAEVRKIVL